MSKVRFKTWHGIPKEYEVRHDEMMVWKGYKVRAIKMRGIKEWHFTIHDGETPIAEYDDTVMSNGVKLARSIIEKREGVE